MLTTKFLKFNKISFLLVLVSIAFYISFAYDLVRTDWLKLLSLYGGLFFLFYKIVQLNKPNFKFLLLVALLFRLIFLFAMPNLSQDFYRFIWDGRMIVAGLNPYLHTPASFLELCRLPFAQCQELYNGMGALNGSHFTNYPPIKQLIFAVSAIFSGKSILGSAIVFRIFIIAADFGTLYFGKKLLEKFNMPISNIFWYLLNPFVIIELTGSLHFEGIMIFFLVWSFYLLQKGNWKLAGVVFALSISVKLIPLMFLPLFYQWFKTKKSGVFKILQFYLIIVMTTIFLFAPFYSSQFLNNYSQTVALWFSDFEFNASLYYVARGIGFTITGYNEIATIGKFIPIIVTLVLLGITFFRNNSTLPKLIVSMLLIATFYYFASTTIHPWYLTTLVILSIFTNYKFPIVWSLMIILSYLAYANVDNKENLWVIAIEYTVVFSIFIWEVFVKKKSVEINSQKLPSNS